MAVSMILALQVLAASDAALVHDDLRLSGNRADFVEAGTCEVKEAEAIAAGSRFVGQLQRHELASSERTHERTMSDREVARTQAGIGEESSTRTTALKKLEATWSWDKLPVFFHSMNQTGPWTTQAAKRVAQYNFATMEKKHALPDPIGTNRLEKSTSEGCQQITSVNGNAVVMYYLNALIDWPWSKLHDLMKQNSQWRLKTATGADYLLNSQWTYNHSVPEMRLAWMNSCLEAAENGCDGCFIDRSNYANSWLPSAAAGNAWRDAHWLAIKDLNGKLQGLGKMTINNNLGNRNWGTVAMMIEDFVASENCIIRLQEAVRRGLVVQTHAGGVVDDGSGLPQNNCNDATNSMAAFLIGAGQYSYYHCSGPVWSSEKAWPIKSDLWLDWRAEYDRPLGKPISNGTRGSDGIWRRNFDSSGKITAVTFDPIRGKGTIAWADGTTQVGRPWRTSTSNLGCSWQTM